MQRIRPPVLCWWGAVRCLLLPLWTDYCALVFRPRYWCR